MTEPMAVDRDQGKRAPKRKRASPSLVAAEWLGSEEGEARAEGLRGELQSLFRYFREVSDGSLGASCWSSGGCGSSLNSAIVCLMEESDRPLSRLVDEVYAKVKSREGVGEGVTVAAVKSSVLMIGQRTCYGVSNADADLLEDETDSCLWCWETRDQKLMPKSIRGALKIRRTARKKIHERITAVSVMLSALQKSENHQDSKHDLMKASIKLRKVLSEADIRLLVEGLLQKSHADMAEKEVKREEKAIVKQLENCRREAEEKRRSDREQKERLQSETDQKKLEAEKDERRREKEQSEMKKQQKRQQEEAEKEQRRKEKEEAEFRKQVSIQKQASIMERFLKRNKNNSMCKNDQSSPKATTSASLTNTKGDSPEPVTQLMDRALLRNIENAEDLWNLHLTSWRSLGHHIRSNEKQHWGIRQKPKTLVVMELKLTTTGGQVHDDELTMEKLVDGLDANIVDEKSCQTPADNALNDLQKHNRSRQLLQFDKSHRPAFYGIWPKKSQIIGPRHPLRKDPELDYDIDSDEEWEEEDPGESLSDCDKDDADEFEVSLKPDDEDESEDGFFVPDGYLSENEGVHVDSDDSDLLVEQVRNPSAQQEFEDVELCLLLKQQKYVHSITEHALRKNQPLIILNLLHEKAPLLGAENLSSTPKVEQACLQALSMRAFPGGPLVEISLENNVRDEDQESCSPSSKGCSTPVATVTALQEADLPKIVSVIQSCSQGMNKVVESLQQTFPSTSKSQLRSKVREISNFVDNRWQVKKDVLDKLGLSISPEKSAGVRTRSIATFFSKRCLPPAAGKCINSSETSPQSSQKPGPSIQQELQDCAYDHP